MNIIWKGISELPFTMWSREKLFILAMGIIGAAAGLCLWCVVRLLCLDGAVWAVCFAGYPFFAATIIALIWLDRQDPEE